MLVVDGSNAYPILMYSLLGGMCAVPVVYVLARIASMAWHRGKLAYQRRLIRELTGEQNGKQVEE